LLKTTEDTDFILTLARDFDYILITIATNGDNAGALLFKVIVFRHLDGPFSDGTSTFLGTRS
jgi:hypothetical protein